MKKKSILRMTMAAAAAAVLFCVLYMACGGDSGANSGGDYRATAFVRKFNGPSPVTPPVTPTTYAVTVSSAGSGSSGGGSYAVGATVTISAGTAPSGQQFKNWTASPSAGVTFANSNSATTTFTMPANAVTVTAVFESQIVTPTMYAVTVSSAGSGSSGGGNYSVGATVTISAGTAPSGQKFKNWTTSSGGVTFANSTSATTTFTMPANAVTVTAVFEANNVTPPPNNGSNFSETAVAGSSFDMIFVPGGTFTMGCTSEQGSDCYSDESPSHSVTLNGYYIGKHEVTQGLWKAVMGSLPSSLTSSSSYGYGDNYPVYYVSWNDVQGFITALNNKTTGRTYRLPTEAEWEYAARGGQSGGTMYSGSNTIGDVAWYSGNNGSSGSSTYGTKPVGGKTPNGLGIYDMSGNVWEWVNDWYGSYSSNAQTNPTGPTTGSYRV